MSAGDFYIRRNNSDTATLPYAGTNLDALWDTEVYDEGATVTYATGTFTFVNTAPYLILYTERFYTSNTTNNTRIEGQGRLRINGSDVLEGASAGYIRKSSGQQDMVISGFAIYNATANDTLVTRFWQGSTQTSGTCSRVPDIGGVQIIELDAADDFARYSTSASQSITSTESNITNWTTDQQETGFSRSTDTVTLSTAGRYLMLVSGATSETGTARLGATIFAENGTTEITGLRGYSHIRGAEGNQNGALSFAGIIDVAASDTITLRGDADSGTMTLDSGVVWQFWQLPSGNETAIMAATTGNLNAQADFAWDTLPHIDTGGFTATAGNANIDVDQGCHALVFWNHGKKVIDSLQRAYPQGQVRVDGVAVNYSASGNYHRNSSSIGTFMVASGGALVHTIPSGSELTIYTQPIGPAGTLDCESGHFSVLNLEGLYQTYTYVFPVTVTDVDTDEVLNNTQTNVIITGTEFLATKGTGLVELVENFDYTGTKITQSTDSWADTSIQFDVTAGVLADTHCFLFVTNDNGSKSYIAVQLGLPPETYQEAVEGMTLSPSHYWMFQNSYADEIGTATANNGSGGSPTFSTTRKLVKADTHSLQLDSTTDYISPADQTDMNTSSQSRRYIGGWIQLDSVSQGLSVIYEEGAQVNNIALLNGFGNNAMMQIANANDDYIQTYFDKALTPNRPYHILLEFNASGYKSGACSLFLDGVKQALSNGNPWETAQLDSHSGNITWGHEGTETLKVGDDRGVDATTIAFVSPTACNYAHWANWSGVTLADATDIRETLFEKGAVSEESITGGTEAAMQTALDAFADTEYADWPCSIEIGVCTAGNFELTMDNITFEDRVSIQVRYAGADTLTLVASNGSVVDSAKVAVPYGGTVTLITPALLSVVGFATGSNITVLSGGTSTILGSDNNATSPYELSVQVATVDIVIIHDDYNVVRIDGVASTVDTQDPDRVYVNP